MKMLTQNFTDKRKPPNMSLTASILLRQIPPLTSTAHDSGRYNKRRTNSRSRLKLYYLTLPPVISTKKIYHNLNPFMPYSYV